MVLPQNHGTCAPANNQPPLTTQRFRDPSGKALQRWLAPHVSSEAAPPHAPTRSRDSIPLQTLARAGAKLGAASPGAHGTV
eukprot:5789543-Alexandrium_andersonii.AAC.1